MVKWGYIGADKWRRFFKRGFYHLSIGKHVKFMAHLAGFVMSLEFTWVWRHRDTFEITIRKWRYNQDG